MGSIARLTCPVINTRVELRQERERCGKGKRGEREIGMCPVGSKESLRGEDCWAGAFADTRADPG